jgi:hypothetical protein
MVDVVRERCPTLLPYVFVCYGCAAHVYVGQFVVVATDGAHKGDPLEPLLFELATQPFISSVQARFANLKHAWLLDDGTVVGAATEAALVAFFNLKFTKICFWRGLSPSKRKLWWPSVDPLPAGRLPAGVGVCRERGVRLLGWFISDSPEYIRATIASKVGEVCSAVERLSVLEDPQAELLLLRACAGVCRLVHLLRCTPPSLVAQGLSCLMLICTRLCATLHWEMGAGLGLSRTRLRPSLSVWELWECVMFVYRYYMQLSNHAHFLSSVLDVRVSPSRTDGSY